MRKTVVRRIFENRSAMGRFFEGVELDESRKRGRLLPTQELQNLYPEDDQVGALWIRRGVLGNRKPSFDTPSSRVQPCQHLRRPRPSLSSNESQRYTNGGGKRSRTGKVSDLSRRWVRFTLAISRLVSTRISVMPSHALADNNERSETLA